VTYNRNIASSLTSGFAQDACPLVEKQETEIKTHVTLVEFSHIIPALNLSVSVNSQRKLTHEQNQR
jgi:hypothetical protein